MHTNPIPIATSALAGASHEQTGLGESGGPSSEQAAQPPATNKRGQVGSMPRVVAARYTFGFLLAAFTLLAACGSGGSSFVRCNPPTQQSANHAGLYDPTPTICDDESNRGAEAGTETAEKIEAANAAEFPANVVANPEACLNNEVEGQMLFANPQLNIDRDLLSDSDPEPEIYAVYEAGAFLVSGDVTAATNKLLAATGLDRANFDFVSIRNAPTGAAPTLVRKKADVDPLAFDPLWISNQIAADNASELGFEVRPNYFFMRSPGAQHSPANEPVPAVGNLSNVNRSADPVLALPSVDVLDSDFNHIVGSPDRMRLSAGHLTFVRGVLEELAPRFPIRSFDFAVGDELDQYLSEWELVSILLDEEAGLGVGPFPDVLNLSAGGYTCDEAGREVPLGTETALEILRTRGVVLVAAAGNDGQVQTSRRFWPAAAADFDGVGDLVIGVKALDNDGELARFSNPYPLNAACALGVDVRSSFPAGEYSYSSTVDGNGDPKVVGVFKGAAVWSGTSFATPQVTAHLLEQLAKLGADHSDERLRFDDGYMEARQDVINSLKTGCEDD